MTDPKWSPQAEMTHCLINGVHYVKTPGGNWAPDYSKPGTAEAVRESVDEAFKHHWSIDKWKP